MRLVVGAALAALLFAAPAAAQTETPAPAPAQAQASSCAALLPTPSNLPDGAAANRQQMTRANEQVVAWASAMHPILDCRRQEAAAAQARAQALTQQYNADANAFSASVTAWQAETEEFNTR